jgi:hypothetical protein
MATLRSVQPAAAELLAASLRDDALSVPLSAKPLSKLAADILAALGSADRAD